MIALLGGMRGILAALGGACAAILLFQAWDIAIDDPRVRASARQEERMAWTEARNKLLAKMAEERRHAQAAIDQIESEYLYQRQRDVLAIESLEGAILEMEKADEADNSGGPSRPAIPGGVSRQLDAVGRTP